MTKHKILAIIFLFLTTLSYAQNYKDLLRHEGKAIQNINVTTARILPEIVKNKFLMHEGDTFTYKDFDYAQKALHDMRIFKSLDIAVAENSAGGLDINIDGEDAYYVFPLPILMSNGGRAAAALILMEANLFKRGELGALSGVYSEDGYMASAGVHLNDNSYSVLVSGVDFEQKMYGGGAYNAGGLFGAEDDEKKQVLNAYNVEKKVAALAYGRTMWERASFRLAYAYNDVSYKVLNNTIFMPDDAGAHHQLNAGLSVYHNIKPSKGMAGAFGSIFGMGTSDKAHRMADLPYVKPGYALSLNYANGGAYTGADGDISKLNAAAAFNLELKTRHTLNLSLNAAQMFEGGFSDQVTDSELLLGKGKYATEYFGQKGWGGGLFACLYVMKNDLALVAFEPFAESMWLFDERGARTNHSGAGASLYVTFWRFQLPIGLNYTKDLTSGDSMVSFVFGAGF